MKIKVIAVGNLKERYFREGCEEYLKRLSAYAKVSVTEIPEYRISKEGPAEIEKCLLEEGERILSKIGRRSCVLALCVEGEQLSSPQLSQKLYEFGGAGYSEIVFVIGGSHGLSNLVKERANMRLSFSEMTFPHQLMRVMLLEQIYRACNIREGGKYHK